MCEGYMRVCNKCKENKPLTDYYVRNDGRVVRICKACNYIATKKHREENKAIVSAWQKEYRSRNKETLYEKKKEYRGKVADKIKAAKSLYYQENKERIEEKAKKYRAENKEIIFAWQKEYRGRNKEALRAKHKEYKRERIKSDPIFKLKRTISRRIHHALKDNYKSESTIKLLGCTPEEAKKHIESTFEPWMTWENHGFYTWHVDHRIPLASFDLTDPEQLAKACHYTNLQALPAKENLSKGAKLNYDCTTN